jgi:hypothetical protein
VPLINPNTMARFNQVKNFKMTKNFTLAWKFFIPSNFERPDLGRWLFWVASDIPRFIIFSSDFLCNFLKS